MPSDVVVKYSVSTLLIYLISLYRKYLSPLKGPTCRFHPTCSEYSLQAITHYGAVRGVLKSVHRLAKCHPYHPGGYDPVH